MMERTWRCTECLHFVFPNYCTVKEIKVDRNYDGHCELVEELETVSGALHDSGDVEEFHVCADCAAWLDEKEHGKEGGE